MLSREKILDILSRIPEGEISMVAQAIKDNAIYSTTYMGPNNKWYGFRIVGRDMKGEHTLVEYDPDQPAVRDAEQDGIDTLKFLRELHKEGKLAGIIRAAREIGKAQ